MNYFFKILRFGLPYKKFAFLNIFFNVLYAIFSALAYVAMIPMMQILFGTIPKTNIAPTYTGIGEIKDYVAGFFNYKLKNIYLFLARDNVLDPEMTPQMWSRTPCLASNDVRTQK